jgi:hypothetical protein
VQSLDTTFFSRPLATESIFYLGRLINSLRDGPGLWLKRPELGTELLSYSEG